MDHDHDPAVLDVVFPALGFPAVARRARPGPVLRMVVALVVAATVAHPRDRVMCPISLAEVGFSRRIVVVPAPPLGAVVGGGAPLGGRHGLAGFARRRRAPAAARLGGWRLFGLSRAAGSAR